MGEGERETEHRIQGNIDCCYSTGSCHTRAYLNLTMKTLWHPLNERTYINTTKQIRKNYRLFMRLISFQLEHSFFLFLLRLLIIKSLLTFWQFPIDTNAGNVLVRALVHRHTHIAWERKRKRSIAEWSVCITQ